MMARLNKGRDFPNATLIANVNACTSSTVDVNCLIQAGALQARENETTDPDGLFNCLHNSCQNTPLEILSCVTVCHRPQPDQS
jgi:hypothetical protein